MKYYKNETTGQVFAFEEDGSQDAFIAKQLVKLTPKEVKDHFAPKPLTYDEVVSLRSVTYKKESDPLKIAAEYDAMISSTAPDYSLWLAKVKEIKDKYPLPSKE